MSAAEIRFIYFDLGNVLLHFDHDQACRQLAELFDVSATEVKEVVFESGLELRYEKGDLSTREFHDLMCDHWHKSPSLDAVKHAAADIFWPNLSTLPVVGHLKMAGYRLGILSNTCEAHWDFVVAGRYPFLNQFFDTVVLSYEARSLKPEPEIYATAIDQAGCDASEVFFMDDRLENVEGATQAGMDAVHFTHGHQLAKDLHHRGVVLNY